MRLLDTSAWIEWLADSPTARKLADKIPERNEWLVPTIVQLELAKWIFREGDEDQSEAAIALTEKCVIAELTTTIAISAAGVCLRHKLATADAVIYATALAHSAELITCDKHFDGLPGVTYIAKARPDLN